MFAAGRSPARTSRLRGLSGLTEASMQGISILTLSCTLALAACSNRQVYDAIQDNQRLECAKLQGSQYEECMKQVSQPYDEYRREREDLIEQQQ